MSEGTTAIECAYSTINPIGGCERASEGCQNCYSELASSSARLRDHPTYRGVSEKGRWTGRFNFHEPALDKISKAKAGERHFLGSMADLHIGIKRVRIPWLRKIYNAVEANPDAIFMVLTKRPRNMFNWFRYCGGVPPNLWLGVSVENQARADERIPELLKLRDLGARVLFVSAEPLLGPIDLNRPPAGSKPRADVYPPWYSQELDWIICGGENAARAKARVMNPTWAVSIRDQCKAAGVPFFYKGCGTWMPIQHTKKGSDIRYLNLAPDGKKEIIVVDKKHGSFNYVGANKRTPGYFLLDGREHREFPEVT